MAGWALTLGSQQSVHALGQRRLVTPSIDLYTLEIDNSICYTDRKWYRSISFINCLNCLKRIKALMSPKLFMQFSLISISLYTRTGYWWKHENLCITITWFSFSEILLNETYFPGGSHFLNKTLCNVRSGLTLLGTWWKSNSYLTARSVERQRKS